MTTLTNQCAPHLIILLVYVNSLSCRLQFIIQFWYFNPTLRTLPLKFHGYLFIYLRAEWHTEPFGLGLAKV